MGFDPGCFWSAGRLCADIGTGGAFLGLCEENSVARRRDGCLIRETLTWLHFDREAQEHAGWTMSQTPLEVYGFGTVFESSVFFPILEVHILAGLVCIVTGIMSMVS